MAGHETDNVESKSVQQSDNTGDSGVGQQISQAQNDGSYQQTFQNQQAETAKASEQMAKDGTLGQMSIGGMDGQNADGGAGKDSSAAQGAESKDGKAADGASKDGAGTQSVEANNQNPMDSKSNTDDMVTTAPGDSGTANDYQPQTQQAPGNDIKSGAETNGLAPQSQESQSGVNNHHEGSATASSGYDSNGKSDSNVDPGPPPPMAGDNPGAPPGADSSNQNPGSDSANQQGSGPMVDVNGNPVRAGQDGGQGSGNHSPYAGGDTNGAQGPHAGGDANGQSAPGGGHAQGGDKNGSKSESSDQGTPSYDALGNYQGPYGDANNANPSEKNPNNEKPNTQGEPSPMGTMQDHMDSMKQPAGPGDNLNNPPKSNSSEAGANNKMDGYTTTGGVLTDTSDAIKADHEKLNQMDMSPKNGSAEGMDNKQMQGNDQAENHSKHNQDNNQKPGDADMKKNGEANQENNESKPNADRNRGGGSGFGRPTSAGRSAVPANSPRW